jgi:hypothetical protein
LYHDSSNLVRTFRPAEIELDWLIQDTGGLFSLVPFCYVCKGSVHGKESRMGKTRTLHLFSAAAALSVMLTLGCATSSMPSAQRISQGDRALRDAQFENASVSAPDELKSAEEKLVRAKQAQADRNYEEAILLAEQAFVDAEVARARASLEKTRRAADEMQKKTRALREDVERLYRQ